ncbi:tetratricopeptide repeat protein [Gemmatimonas sp.]|uniref:tetratricopeptide repeat protein n=1 Tax=Gemmatimonas sp. TaxID=1962908 RepID=UPI0039833394
MRTRMRIICRGAIAAVLVAALVVMSPRSAATQSSPQPTPIDRALAAGLWREAVRMLDSALAKAPRDATSLQQRGRAHRELEEFEQALADYTQALAVDRRFAAAYGGRAIVHQRVGNGKAAFADIDSARALGMSDPQLDLVEGIGYMMNDDGAKAWARFDKYVRAVPDAAQGWFLRGRAAGMSGRTDDAEKDFTAAIERRMAGPEVYTLRAMARVALKNTAGACADLAQAAKLGDKAAATTAAKNCKSPTQPR